VFQVGSYVCWFCERDTNENKTQEIQVVQYLSSVRGFRVKI